MWERTVVRGLTVVQRKSGGGRVRVVGEWRG